MNGSNITEGPSIVACWIGIDLQELRMQNISPTKPRIKKESKPIVGVHFKRYFWLIFYTELF